jgi:hypothetical protein
VEVERTVDAPMQRVWVVLRDYRAARPRMLTEHFADYAVQQQEGERTVIEYRLRVGRHQRRYVAAVEEPMAGRQLRERDLRSALVITWTLTRAATASARSCAWPPSCATPTSTAGLRAGAPGGRCACSTVSCSSTSTPTSPPTQHDRAPEHLSPASRAARALQEPSRKHGVLADRRGPHGAGEPGSWPA